MMTVGRLMLWFWFDLILFLFLQHGATGERKVHIYVMEKVTALRDLVIIRFSSMVLEGGRLDRQLWSTEENWSTWKKMSSAF